MDSYANIADSDLWDSFVGQQGVAEFIEFSDETDIEASVRAYAAGSCTFDGLHKEQSESVIVGLVRHARAEVARG